MRLSVICIPLFLAALGASAQSQVILPEPLLWLQFDEGEGSIVRDASGHENHATLHGDAERVTGFRGTLHEGGSLALEQDAGGAVRFGEGRWATVPHDDMFNVTREMTVACWVKLEGDAPGGVDAAMSYQQAAFEKGAAWGEGLYSLMPDFNNNVLFQAHDLHDACDDELQGGYILGDGWRHIAGTWDSDTIRVYVDGEKIDDLSCPGDMGSNSEPIYIGARGGEQRWLLGVLDELYVYDVALTDAEVKVLYEGNEIIDSPPGPLATQWGRIRSGLVARVEGD